RLRKAAATPPRSKDPAAISAGDGRSSRRRYGPEKGSVVAEAGATGEEGEAAAVTVLEPGLVHRRLLVHQLPRIADVVQSDQVPELVQDHRAHPGRPVVPADHLGQVPAVEQHHPADVATVSRGPAGDGVRTTQTGEPVHRRVLL